MLIASCKITPISIGEMSLSNVSTGIGQTQSSKNAFMVGRSREKTASLTIFKSRGASKPNTVGSFGYLREPVATIVQNSSGDWEWQSLGVMRDSKMKTWGA